MSDVQTLLRDIERFIAAHEMAPSTFGRKAVNDGKLVARLRDGGNITLQTAADIRSYMAANSTPGTPVEGAAA